MKKEIISRASKIALGMTLGILLFPYLENYVTDYYDQLGFFASLLLFISLLIIVFPLYFFLMRISFVQKLDANNQVSNTIDYVMHLIVLTAFIIAGLKLMNPYVVCIFLICAEAYHLFLKGLEKEETL